VFTGGYAVNPATGKPIPIWIADYVLMTYGTGAIMAVPGHDTRDFEFATQFGLEIREVIAPPSGAQGTLAEAYTEDGVMVNSGQFNGLPAKTEGLAKVCDWFESRGIGERSVQFRIRDWLISRQRYWGPPIPMIYCEKCGTVPVPDDQLPVLLPDIEDFRPTGTGSSPLAQLDSFVNTTCPNCDGPAKRETDVSDNFLDSGWYFLRYPSSDRDDVAWSDELTKKWLPVASYIGGAEHSVLHLLYSRFITMALKDIGLLDFEEPFKRFRAHGLITKDGAKMSKSKGNVVNPAEYITRWGADTIRMYLMFLGPYDQGGDFSDSGIGGVYRFLHRLWALVAEGELAEGDAPIEAQRVRHRTIKKVSEEIESLKYNTAIAALMEYLNFLQKQPKVYQAEARAFILLIAPLAPFIAEELWSRVGGTFSVHQQAWPSFDPALAALERLSIPVQINGKTREVIEVDAGADEEAVKAAALGSERVQKHLAGKTVRRIIYVPGRMLNVVI
jgi:leucyl-tRNA synthetase